MRFLLFSLLAGSMVLGSSVARADDSGPAPSTQWYGYQTLATDGLALGLGALSAASATGNGDGFAVGALAVYGLGAPIVHFAHGRVGTGFIDLGLRLALPTVTALVGYSIGSSSGSSAAAGCRSSGSGFCSFDVAYGQIEGIEIGVLAGMAAAGTIDAVFLAREPAPPRPGWSPTLSVTPEHTGGTRATIGVVGTF